MGAREERCGVGGYIVDDKESRLRYKREPIAVDGTRLASYFYVIVSDFSSQKLAGRDLSRISLDFTTPRTMFLAKTEAQSGLDLVRKICPL